MESIKDQESFMHLIYDCVHNGIGIHNLKYRLEDLKSRNIDLEKLLNTRMKNEIYYDSFEYPINKVIMENWNHISYYNKEDFFNTKLMTIKLLQNYGANINKISEKYMNEDINIDFLLYNKIINKEIFDYINQNKIVIII
jgi:hypothetical protein